MSTIIRLGPSDHGRPMTYDEFMSGDYEEGYRYELIDGRLYVSSQPNYPHDIVQRWLNRCLMNYCQSHPDIVGDLTNGSRIFVPSAKRTTAPEPDMALYKDLPLDQETSWRDVSPFIVIEVLSGENAEKALKRNVDLYLRVPSIEEYWVFDARESALQPTLIVHRRRGEKWTVEEYDADAVYMTPLLPGFELPVSPGRK